MSIDQQCSQDDHMNDVPDAQAAAHARLALEQSALYETRLAIARWITSSLAATQVPAPPMAQARWYDKAQRDLQEWLARGGFSQPDTACAEPDAALVVAIPVVLQTTPLANTSHTCVD